MDTWTELLEEAKRRAILLAIVALTLAYVMSLTSSSVWINLPIAILLLAALRRVSFEIEIRWKPVATEQVAAPQLTRRQLSSHDPLLSDASRTAANRWRHHFDSPVVEAAVDELTRRLIDEWVTNLWYSSITPDQDAPEELRVLVNDLISEVAQRAKRVNLITLLSKDVVNLVATQFDLYRRMKAKVGPDIMGSLSTEDRDDKLKHAMMSSRELHPALVSPEAEYKVLKRLSGGVLALVLRRQDAQCRLLRTMAREFLACVVLRPVISFASPAFINEVIENQELASKERARLAAEVAADAAAARLRMPPERMLQRKASVSGLEMTALGRSGSESAARGLEIVPYQKKSVAIPSDDAGELGPIPRGDWAQVLDAVTQRKAQALTPEHLDNLWTKGRNYKQRESENAAARSSVVTTTLSKKDKAKAPAISPRGTTTGSVDVAENTSPSPVPARKERNEQYKALLFGDPNDGDEGIPGIGFSPAPSLQNPEFGRNPDFVKCWSNDDLTSFNRDSQAEIGGEGKDLGKSGVGDVQQRQRRPPRHLSQHRRSRSMGGDLEEWQEPGVVAPGEGFLTLVNPETGPPTEAPSTTTKNQKQEKSVDAQEKEKSVRRASTRTPASAVAPGSTASSLSTVVKCQVVGAHFEKSGSKAFAVYTIKVTDAANRKWQVQRRYRNFEQLHRRLKDVPSYSLSLPPKRFLSSNLDTSFVRERCILLGKYLKELLAIPSVAELHEVWDFLSVNSQRYSFGISPSMMKTLAVNVDDAMDDMFRQIRGVSDNISGALNLARQRFPLGSGDVGQAAILDNNTNLVSKSSTSAQPKPLASLVIPDNDFGEKFLEEEYLANFGAYAAAAAEDQMNMSSTSGVERVGSVEWHSDGEFAGDSLEANALKAAAHDYRWSERRFDRALSDGHSPVDSFASDSIEDELVIPQEWSPPKVTVPLLNLVDQVFQLQGRGWIRRQVLWIAKQILQLGMGDALDDWLIARIQWLRKEEVVASGICWLKGVLWPDGIFVTKHPMNLSPTSSTVVKDFGMEISEEIQEVLQQRPPMNSFEQKCEAARRAGVVREIILEKAPATLVNLIGKKQYTRCAKDIYYFSQASVCTKQLAYSLLEMLFLATFPELHDLVLDVRSNVQA